MAGEKHTGIFLHPRGIEDAVVAFRDVAIPDFGAASEALRVFLMFHIGIRDGVQWHSKTAPPNGVRFAVCVAGQRLFEEDLTESVWRARALDMRPWAGQGVDIEFRTNAIDRNTSYDWSVFGDPLLCTVNPVMRLDDLPRESAGIALARVVCDVPAAVTLAVGEVSTQGRFDKGSHWLPIHFTGVCAPSFTSEVGDAARMEEIMFARHAAEVVVEDFALSSPLITADRPFNIALKIKNAGRGHFEGGSELTLQLRPKDASPPRPAAEDGIALPLNALAPGASATLVWRDLVVREMGDWQAAVEPVSEADALRASLNFHAFPAEPGGAVSGKAGEGVRLRASVRPAHGKLGLTIVEDEARACYALAQCQRQGKLATVGSLYPLASAVFRKAGTDAAPVRIEGAIHVDTLEVQQEHVDVKGHIAGQEVHIRWTADPVSPRVHLRYELEATESIELLSFVGPSIAAGDRAYGSHKDFAVFPGLEYLEGGEHSSSERDIAYPSSDRRVPVAYKITAPLMAVQGNGTLMALIWDMDQPWAAGERRPAARFLAPPPDEGLEHVRMSLFAPSVGTYLKENTWEAETPYRMAKGDKVTLEAWLILDAIDNYEAETVAAGPHAGGLVLQAFRHYFDLFGFPAPSPQPRAWDAEKALCLKGYLDAVWSEDPPGWRHCHGWAPGLLVGHSVPLFLLARDGADKTEQDEIHARIDRVIRRALDEQGPHYLWTNAGCHIMMAELPFYYGFLPESLRDFRDNALRQLAAREDGLWVWRPASEKHATLGVAGGHTLGQASYPSMLALRAARMTGDPELIAQALEAMKQMERYEVPRGAQMWECPLYQPDILAAARAIRAYCEAYRLTGDPAQLGHARYWAWTGLPFLYLWDMDGYPTMRYNVISVIGSTFHTHSWLGLPVVWCGLVYAYALLDLAQYDDSLDWRAIAQGITNSTMWQQYTEGPSAGTYPDSWNMVRNTPNPADINPENILVNELRLRGRSPEIRYRRVPSVRGTVVFNSAADITSMMGTVDDGTLSVALAGDAGYPAFAFLAPVAEPRDVMGAGVCSASSAVLQEQAEGWFFDPELRAVILKTGMEEGKAEVTVQW